MHKTDSLSFTAEMFTNIDKMGIQSETATFASPTNMLHNYINQESVGPLKNTITFGGGTTQLQQTSVIPGLISRNIQAMNTLKDKNIKNLIR